MKSHQIRKQKRTESNLWNKTNTIVIKTFTNLPVFYNLFNWIDQNPFSKHWIKHIHEIYATWIYRQLKTIQNNSPTATAFQNNYMIKISKSIMHAKEKHYYLPYCNIFFISIVRKKELSKAITDCSQLRQMKEGIHRFGGQFWLTAKQMCSLLLLCKQHKGHDNIESYAYYNSHST